MQEDNIAVRLKFLINKLGINSSVFADNCGISRATLSQLLTGRNKKISDIIIGQIHKAYPDLSILWLLFNEGSMWSSGKERDINSIEENSEVIIPEKNEGLNSSQDNTGESDENLFLKEKIWDETTPAIKITHENRMFPSNSPEARKISEGNSPKSPDFSNQQAYNQTANSNCQTQRLLDEIEALRKKVRKITQITIYFDDSTFETFYPK